MTNNCLITKLKGVISSSSHLKFGEISLHVNASVSGIDREFTWVNGQTGYVRTLDSSNKIKFISSTGAFTNYVEIPAGTTNHTIIFDTGEYDIAVGNLYNIRTFNPSSENNITFTADLNRLIYSENLYEVTCGRYNSSQQSINDIQFNLDNFSNYGNNINILNFDNCKDQITGNINVMSNKRYLRKMYLRNQTNIEGCIETLLENHINVLGKSSGELDMELKNTKITIDNKLVSSLSRSTFHVFYTETGCVIRDTGDPKREPFATYVKSTNTWTYNNL